MKIKKYNLGGAVYTPHQYGNTGVESQTTPVTTTKEKSNSDNKITGTLTEDIITALSTTGLPTDVNALLSYSNDLLTRSSSLSTSSLFGGDNENTTMSSLIQILGKANAVKFNKSLYDDAEKAMSTENSGSEVATNNGRMYVQNSNGELELIDPSKYYENSENYNVLTNDQMMIWRANDPSLAFDSNILNSVASSVGMESVNTYLRTIIKDFGKSSITGYTNKQQERIESGMSALIEGGPDGYYKVTQEDQVKDSDVNIALNYLYNALPTNMKQFLRAKTASEGHDPNTESNKLLGLMLMEHTSSKTSADFDKEFEDKSDSSKSGASKSSTEKYETMDYATKIVTGEALPSPLTRQIAPEGSKSKMKVPVQNVGPLLQSNGTPNEQNNLEELFKTTVALDLVDRRSVTFGDELIEPEDFNKIVWDGASNLDRVMLPIKNESGKITPDFELLTQYDEIQEYIDNNPGITNLEINELIKQSFGDKVTYDRLTEKLKINPNIVMPFLSITAYASENSMEINEDSKFMTKLDSDKGSKIKELYNQLMLFGKRNPTKSDYEADASTASNRSFYEANVFMPILDPMIANIHQKTLMPQSATIDPRMQHEQKMFMNAYEDEMTRRQNPKIQTTFN